MPNCQPTRSSRTAWLALVIALILAPIPLTIRATALPGVRPSAAAVVADYRPPVPPEVLAQFDPPAQNWLTGHRGVDLVAPQGTLVRSPAAGVVTFAGKVGGKPVVTVTHPDGLRSSFEPVVATVEVGDQVESGHPIGEVSQWPEGTASHCPSEPGGACLHWGVRRGDVYLDPLTLIGAARPIVLLPLSTGIGSGPP